GDVKVKVWNSSGFKNIRYLQSIDWGMENPFVCFDGGRKRGETFLISSWPHMELIKPRYKLKSYEYITEWLEKYPCKAIVRSGFISLSREDFPDYEIDVSMLSFCGEEIDELCVQEFHPDWYEEIIE
ncbi:hypothetical protein KY339_00950, partial [Candidatus Woesearchaeota archaeon]|nr:hypothetical protein [Candidatus Woesearchaeota archaeon]